ncbi:hypothetical protein JQC67_10970 [Aurantibacter crassamenti]|uniref:hypothetical protein n=1 Tax=Aurantibacter crassamenti TaxID=1837375 RepID=UPI00193A97DF|nr:hypothetical protein [Aurantibacter crassamenti]MBM1106661.1 hypothetical protein [Aurantibacter crassamenti]
MKKSLFLVLIILFYSCDDGDLTIDTIDFDSVDMQNCDTADIDTTVFFKINDDEALILELQSGLLLNEASTTDIVSTIGSGSNLTYRVFSEDVSSTYFCSDIPPTLPTVLSEIQASNGVLNIKTEAVENDTLSFMHTFTLSDITFESDNNSRITNLTINDFGTITTVKSE